MDRAFDWDGFAARHWLRAPACLRWPDPGFGVSAAYRMTLAASAPFRAGTRFFSLPNARLFVDDAEIRAPGDLLPGGRDRTVSAYLRRLAARFPQAHACLDIEQPLLMDYPAWSGVRKALSALWERVGHPVLPAATAFSLGRYRRDHASDHAGLLWVLRGDVRIALRSGGGRRRSGETVLEGKAGDLLYWPSDHHAHETSKTGCFVMRLSIPQTAGALDAGLEELLATLLQPRLYPDGRTPYLAFPAPSAEDGATVLPDAFVRLREALRQASDGEAMAQALRVQWISRVSASGLEPVPAPVERPALRATDRIRLSDGVRIVRMPYDASTALWAANGYAFAVEQAPRFARLHAALAQGTDQRVDGIFRSGSAAGRERALSTLLDGLHAVRAIECVGAQD